MNTKTAALLFTAALPLSAAAEDSIVGNWRVEEVNNNQTPEDVSLTLAFDDKDKASLVYTLPGEPGQSWDYAYKLDGVTLTLEPKNPVGKPDAVEYEIRFEEGKLLLLPPKPEPVEEPEAEEESTDPEAEEAAEPGSADDADASDAGGGAEGAEEASPEGAAEESEGDTPAAESEEGDSAEEASPEAAEEEEEEDTRKPVWILAPAGE